MCAALFPCASDLGRMPPQPQLARNSTRGRRETRMDTLEARSGQQLRHDYLDRARDLQPMLRADSDEVARRREVTPEVVGAMIERGIFKMLLPRSIGGAELAPLTYTAVLELLAQADGSTAWCLGQNSGCSMIAPYLAPENAR